jgi:hypothetical protein
VRQRPFRPELADLTTLDKIMDAVTKLKNGKTGGNSGILPEIMNVAC